MSLASSAVGFFAIVIASKKMGLRRMRRSPVDILLVLTQFQPLDRLVPIPTSEPSLLQVSRLSSISLSSPSDPPSTVCPRRASHQVIRKRISKVYEEVTILAVAVKNPRHGLANSQDNSPAV